MQDRPPIPPSPHPANETPAPLSCLSLYSPTPDEDAFLDDLQHRIFLYFWNEVYPETGMAVDHTENRIGKVAATGFELAAICIGIERGWITREQGYERTLRILNMFYDDPNDPHDIAAEGHFGLWWHFLDGKTGKMKPIDCVAVCDSADMVGGIILVGEYFKGSEVETLARKIVDRIEWDKFVHRNPDGSPELMSFGWVPPGVSETYPQIDGLLPGGIGFLADNSLLFYVLGLGSDTHPIPQATWDQYVDTIMFDSFDGIECAFAGQLFCRQVPHAFIRFSRKRDRRIEYFLDTVNAILADRAFNMKVNGFPDTLWGLTDCFGKDTYTHSGPPGPIQNNDGTCGSTAFGGALPHVPRLSMDAMRYVRDRYGDRVWGRYGFTSSVNAKNDFVSPLYVGIEQGPLIMLIENYRTGLIWDLFSQSSVMKNFVKRARISGVVDDFELPPEAPPYAKWTADGCRLEESSDQPQHGHRCLSLRDAEPTISLRAQLTQNDLLDFCYDRYLALWVRDLTPVRCTAVIDNTEMELRAAGHVPGLGDWVQYFYRLPTHAQNAQLCAVGIEAQIGGPRPALDNLTCEATARVVMPEAVQNLKAVTGRLGATIDITWSAPHSERAAASSYLITAINPAEPESRLERRVKALAQPGGMETCTLVLEPGQSYEITVTALDDVEHAGPESTPVVAVANAQPLNPVIHDFTQGPMASLENPNPRWTLRVNTEEPKRGLQVDYVKDHPWHCIIIPVDPNLVALHRYIIVRAKGISSFLGKIWCTEDFQQDLNHVHPESIDEWTDLYFDTRMANSIFPARDRVVKFLLFPTPGQLPDQGTFYIESIRYEN